MFLVVEGEVVIVFVCIVVIGCEGCYVILLCDGNLVWIVFVLEDIVVGNGFVCVLIGGFDMLIVVDFELLVLLVLVECVVVVDIIVLINGLMGIGKEVLVCIIYNGLLCKDGLFIVINCVVFFELMFEVMLFGY